MLHIAADFYNEHCLQKKYKAKVYWKKDHKLMCVKAGGLNLKKLHAKSSSQYNKTSLLLFKLFQTTVRFYEGHTMIPLE
jgi:hypothetical protein